MQFEIQENEHFIGTNRAGSIVSTTEPGQSHEQSWQC